MIFSFMMSCHGIVGGYSTLGTGQDMSSAVWMVGGDMLVPDPFQNLARHAVFWHDWAHSGKDKQNV